MAFPTNRMTDGGAKNREARAPVRFGPGPKRSAAESAYTCRTREKLGWDTATFIRKLLVETRFLQR